MNQIKNPHDRFWPKVRLTECCWVWRGSLSWSGYGRFYVGDGTRPRTAMAHRWLYEQVREPIPAGLQLDHLCRNPPCVNPDHLEAVTGRVNLLRSRNFAAVNAKKTHCANGHEFTPETTAIDKLNRRTCIICRRAVARARAKARREANPPPPRQKKTHCPRGHEYSPANTYVAADSSRHCRACGRLFRGMRRPPTCATLQPVDRRSGRIAQHGRKP